MFFQSETVEKRKMQREEKRKRIETLKEGARRAQAEYPEGSLMRRFIHDVMQQDEARVRNTARQLDMLTPDDRYNMFALASLADEYDDPAIAKHIRDAMSPNVLPNLYVKP